jgi:hypothetical protein
MVRIRRIHPIWFGINRFFWRCRCWPDGYFARLPTKDNLVRRHIIPPNASHCVTGCGGVEMAHHLFLFCLVFAPLWNHVRSWIGIFSANPSVLHDHFLQFTYSAGGSQARRFFIHMLWLYCIWVVWHERNNRVFKAKESTILQLLDKVKVYSLWWIKTYDINIGLILTCGGLVKSLDLCGHWLVVVWFLVDSWGPFDGQDKEEDMIYYHILF